MNREDIQKMIQTNNLNRNSPGLLGVLVRTYDQLCELDKQMGNNIVEKDCQQLEQENKELEKSILQTNNDIEQTEKNFCISRKKIQEDFAILHQKDLDLDNHIKVLKAESDSIKQEMENIKDRPTNLERLRRRQQDLQKENTRLETELRNLGEEYQQKIDLYDHLNVFVIKLETLETRLSQVMNEIWKRLKNDSFDRMCNS